MRIIYNAKRNLATGHSLDEIYEIVIAGEVIDPEFLAQRTENTSMDGTEEFELHNIRTDWIIRTDIVQEGQATEDFEEFIWSTMAGEVFTFDPFSDQVGVDVAPRLVRQVLKRFRKRRTNHTSYHRYPLKLREV